MSPREEPDSVEWMRQRWLEQNEPKPEHFAAMATLLRTTILVTDEMDRVLKECQLSRTGYLILITLQTSREQTRPLGQLSKVLLVHPTTVTMAIDQLEKPGLVRRVPHPTDRRTVLARLTGRRRPGRGTGHQGAGRDRLRPRRCARRRRQPAYGRAATDTPVNRRPGPMTVSFAPHPGSERAAALCPWLCVLGCRDIGEPQHADGGLAHLDLADLAACRHREVLDDPNVTRDLVVGQLAVGELPDVGRCHRWCAGTQPYPCHDLFTESRVRHPDDLDVLHVPVGVQELLDLAWRTFSRPG